MTDKNGDLGKINKESAEGLKRVSLSGAFNAYGKVYSAFQGSATMDSIAGRIFGTLTDPFGIATFVGTIQAGSFSFTKLYVGTSYSSPITHELHIDEDGDWLGEYRGYAQAPQGAIVEYQGAFFLKKFTDAADDAGDITREGFGREFEKGEKLIQSAKERVSRIARNYLPVPTGGTRLN